MTDQYEQVYRLIKESVAKNGYSMSHVEIGKAIGKSRQRVDQIVDALVQLGKVKKLKPGVTVPVE